MLGHHITRLFAMINSLAPWGLAVILKAYCFLILQIASGSELESSGNHGVITWNNVNPDHCYQCRH